MRSRMHRVLKGNHKTQSTEALLGCSFEYAKSYLEQRFQPGMSWDNYGIWHIDNIKPCAQFDLTRPEEQRTCFHITNLQPLWGRITLVREIVIRIIINIYEAESISRTRF